MLGGKGVRFGSSTPKQFHDVGSVQKKLLFELTASRLLSITLFEIILLVIPKRIKTEELKIFQEALTRLRVQYPQVVFQFTHGGDDRHGSFEQAFFFLEEKKIEPSALAVHDANRPFLSDSFLIRIKQEIKKINHDQACSIPTVPSVDSLLYDDQVGSDKSPHYLSRTKIHCVQTPQLLCWRAVSIAFEKKKYDKSWADEGSFLLDMGFAVTHYLGESDNKKITYQKDLL